MRSACALYTHSALATRCACVVNSLASPKFWQKLDAQRRTGLIFPISMRGPCVAYVWLGLKECGSWQIHTILIVYSDTHMTPPRQSLTKEPSVSQSTTLLSGPVRSRGGVTAEYKNSSSQVACDLCLWRVCAQTSGRQSARTVHTVEANTSNDDGASHEESLHMHLSTVPRQCMRGPVMSWR